MSPPTSPEEARFQPPFAPHATSPDDRSLPPPHPSAEAMLNATAAHVFPGQQGPNNNKESVESVDRGADVSISIQGTAQNEAPPRKESGETTAAKGQAPTPTMTGTPLEEMKTPAADKPSETAAGVGGRPFTTPGRRQRETSAATVQTPTVVTADEDASTAREIDKEETATPTVPPTSTDGRGLGGGRPTRPGFGAVRDMGSVSPRTLVTSTPSPIHDINQCAHSQCCPPSTFNAWSLGIRVLGNVASVPSFSPLTCFNVLDRTRMSFHPLTSFGPVLLSCTDRMLTNNHVLFSSSDTITCILTPIISHDWTRALICVGGLFARKRFEWELRP